ncbi:MAG: translocation/assembly module TamB domain-containing protein [Acidobacteriia bacterium]|nr:translocation/assembly module TamB domain-containing protein [Terriglobia bacterium]
MSGETPIFSAGPENGGGNGGGQRRRSWRWLRHALWILPVKIALITVGIAIFFGSGAGDRILRRTIVHRLEAMTGGRVELQQFSMRWWGLHAKLGGLVLHGSEPEGTEPLLTVEELDLTLRIDSIFGRKISLAEAILRAPHVHLRVNADGTSNLPAPPRGAASIPFSERLFDLRIGKVRISDGWMLYNDVRTPLALEGGALRLALDAGGPPQQPVYFGTLDWRQLSLTAQRLLPVPANLALKFTLAHNSFRAEQLLVQFGRSQVDLQAEVANFADPAWSFRYRGWLRLEDAREILRKPMTPGGRVDMRGAGTLARGQVRIQGSYSAQEIALNYPEIRAAGLVSRGSYAIDNHGAEVPDFFAQAFGGSVTGRVSVRFPSLAFRAETRVRGAHLASVLAALARPSFPVDALHWDSLIAADTVETWTADFQNFEVSGQATWSAPAETAPGLQPVAGQFAFRYRHDPRELTVDSGEITAPTSRFTVTGLLSRMDSALDVHFETGDLAPWSDFIHAIRGLPPAARAAAPRISGSARWDGRILGPIAGPAFLGHARGERIRYDVLAWDLVEGDLAYSPGELSVNHGRARYGDFDAELDASLQLTGWSFLPGNQWTADINVLQSSVDHAQQLFGLKLPVSGHLAGQFHGSGTRAAPSVTGLFDLADGRADGVYFHRLRGQVNWTPEELRVANAELRIFPPGKDSGQGAGIVTGTAAYRFADGNLALDLAGAALPLESFERLQTPRLPVGGRLSFRLKSQGPLGAPQAEGTFRIVDLRVGPQVIGSFEGKLFADGSEARLELGSAMAAGKLSGVLRVALHDDLPVSGNISVNAMDLDPFVITALHLPPLSGHGEVSGEFEVSGALRQPQSLAIEANLTRLVLNYANVRLENEGPVRFRYTREELRVSQATFRGPDTNLEIAGLVQFSGARRINLLLNGAWNLRLLSGFFPELEASGPAQIHAAVEGTLDRPSVKGRMHIENAAARVRDFPTGLSALTGDFVFDANRLFFENVTAEAGGGTLQFSGSVNYADRPLRYDITARTAGVRVRYPEGMSWLMGGELRLTGTPQAGLVAGRVTVGRVSLSEGLQIAGALAAAKEGISGPSTASPYLRNLQFDIEARSAPDSRMEWPGAELEADANLRIRGTWEHPILLGHIHILSGDLTFAGNRYRVTRGDLNFANPFRIDPVLNVEATTTIQQYEITLNFSGPTSKLTLAYRSDPPLPVNDIVTLLAMGKTSAEGESRSGGTAQSATSGASALLSEAISSQLGGRLERLFGITRFRVDPGIGGVGSTGAAQSAAARVTVEQRVARNLTITYISNVTSTQQQVIQVEYNVNRNFSIVALRDQNGTFGLDVKFKKRFQ